jgi:hypothetical protein
MWMGFLSSFFGGEEKKDLATQNFVSINFALYYQKAKDFLSLLFINIVSVCSSVALTLIANR